MAYEFYEKLKKLSEITKQKNPDLSAQIEDAMKCGMTSTEILMRSRYEITNKINEIKDYEAIKLANDIIKNIDRII